MVAVLPDREYEDTVGSELVPATSTVKALSAAFLEVSRFSLNVAVSVLPTTVAKSSVGGLVSMVKVAFVAAPWLPWAS